MQIASRVHTRGDQRVSGTLNKISITKYLVKSRCKHGKSEKMSDLNDVHLHFPGMLDYRSRFPEGLLWRPNFPVKVRSLV